MKLEDKYGIAVSRKTIMFLRWIRIFPTEEEIKHPSKKILSKYAILTLLGSYFPIGMGLSLIMKVKMHTYTKLDEDIMMFLSFLSVLWFNLRFSAHTEKLAIVYGKLSDFKSFDKPKNFDTFNGFMNRKSIIFFISELTAVMFISFSNVFLIESCEENNGKTGINEVCGMVGTIWLPFDYDYFPVKHIVFTYEFYASLMAYNTAGFINWVIYETIAHINFRFQHLEQTFLELLRIQDFTERRKQFNKAVQYHTSMIEVAEMACSCFKPCCIVHLSLTAPVVGIAGYRLVTSTSYCDVSIFVTYVFCVLVACQTGQGLQDSTSILTDVLYNNTSWYDLDEDLRKDLLLVMLRARQPIYLNAGPLGNMGYATVLLLGKTAYSYLTLFNRTM